LKDCRATASLILRCLRYRCKSLLFNAVLRQKLQRRRIRSKLIWVSKNVRFTDII